MNRKLLFISITAIAVIFLFIYLFNPGDKGVTGNSVKEFNTQISGYNYNPDTINVNLGDTVRIKIKNNDRVTHGISLPGFGVQQFVKPGQTTTIQFVADKKGDPETFCITDHGEKLLINVA